jgi:hypothetical protein
MYAGRQFAVVGFTLVALLAAQQMMLALMRMH